MGLSKFVYIWRDKGSSDTLILLHGTGGTESDLIQLAEMIDPSANLLGLRGNSREEGVNRFFRRKAEGVLDEEDIRVQSEELRLFLTAASADYKFSLDRAFALGYSNGANIAASLLLLYPKTLRGAILLRPMAPFRDRVDSEEPVGPVLVLSGSQDSIIPSEQTLRLIAQLRERGSEVAHVVQNAGHELVRNDVTEAQRWLAALREPS